MIACLTLPPKRRPAGPRGLPPLGAAWPPAAHAIAALQPTGCRWPLGEVAAENFRFCNAKRQRGAYCPQHAALARRSGRR